MYVGLSRYRGFLVLQTFWGKNKILGEKNIDDIKRNKVLIIKIIP